MRIKDNLHLLEYSHKVYTDSLLASKHVDYISKQFAAPGYSPGSVMYGDTEESTSLPAQSHLMPTQFSPGRYTMDTDSGSVYSQLHLVLLPDTNTLVYSFSTYSILNEDYTTDILCHVYCPIVIRYIAVCYILSLVWSIVLVPKDF